MLILSILQLYRSGWPNDSFWFCLQKYLLEWLLHKKGLYYVNTCVEYQHIPYKTLETEGIKTCQEVFVNVHCVFSKDGRQVSYCFGLLCIFNILYL